MNIYYVSDSELSKSSVHTVHIDAICKNLSRSGNQVRLYVPGNKKIADANYKITAINVPNVIRSVFYQIFLFIRLSFDISKKRPDVIYSRHSQFLFIPIVISVLFNIPVILEVNGRLVDETIFDRRWIARVLDFLNIYSVLEAFNLRRASEIITTTEGVKEYICQTYNLNPLIVNAVTSAVDQELFKPNTGIGESINFVHESVCIGYVGSLKEWQGLQYIVQSAKLVIASRPQTQFLIVGDGEAWQYLLSFIKDNGLQEHIKLHPAVPHTTIPTYINMLDICISYPVKFRAGATSPFKIYEYLACGKPVISADIKGMREEFQEVIQYVEPESPTALAAALVSLIDNKSEREHLGKLGREFIEKGHTWEAVTQRIMLLCEKAVASHGDEGKK
jgi:glycosyltransferase involved in cell wall biosynthesis